MSPAPELYALCLMYAECWSEAESALRSRPACGPAGADTHVGPGLCLEMRGEIRAAIRELEAAEELNAHEAIIVEELEGLRTEGER